MNQEDDKIPKLRLKKEIRDKLEAENMSIEDYFEQKEQEQNDKLKKEDMEYRLKYPESPKLTNYIDLPINIQNLGYERQFLSRADADFLIKEIENWEDENSILEMEPHLEEQKEQMIQIYLATGIRYNFKNIGISLFYVPLFLQDNYNDGSAQLNYCPTLYKYDHFKNEFSIADNDDFHDITF